ncbi:hypothetical protein J8C02_14525 [Chloracidobacterium sp. MS 40/45]|uniref:hypothetical protein n=1 Tax=Chloracidobacterium aggregatum TaxID=2851959 RepID=UPI001B8AAB97|nr:hypothetical protein [Chloracidobacterium aggregatum]QUW01351.1 hypothetical protein J8C02_14525 [Chloracidobacterium sp. MS 40/45]
MAIAFRIKVATLCAAVSTAFIGFSLLPALRPVAGSDATTLVVETTPQDGPAAGAGASKPSAPVDPATARARIYRAAKDKTEDDWRLQNGNDSGCISCHTGYEGGYKTAHIAPDGSALNIGRNITCVYCHGGNGEVTKPAGSDKGQPAYIKAQNEAHPQPTNPKLWKRKDGSANSANPELSYTALLKENLDFVRFVNPGDLRVADITCGECHNKDARLDGQAFIVDKVKTSMMTHGAMLWGAALYNNGAYPYKDTRWGESYNQDGAPQALMSLKPPTPSERKYRGIIPFITPLPRWEVTQPGNILRVFERGGRKQSEVGNPFPEADLAGLPEVKLSPRGFGTVLRTDPVFLGLQKTRLLDPLTSLMGTNDHPGDYRSSGCTACHTPYANDRSPVHSSTKFDYAHTNRGTTKTADPTIPRDEPGHPVRHVLTNAIPTSQCMVCHMHPGTNMLTTYQGFMWWDNETDGRPMYPETPLKRSDEELENIARHNPEGSAQRGKWGDRAFLGEVWTEVNPKAQRTQFADFHGHGWIYRAVFKQDRKGRYLDENDQPVPNVTPEALREAVNYTSEGVEVNKTTTRNGVPVHLKDIHLEKGLHCVDCHFSQDGHGDRLIYGEPRASIEISCQDCHGSIYAYANPKSLTTGFAGGARKKSADDALLTGQFTARNKTESEAPGGSNSLDGYKTRTVYERDPSKRRARGFRQASVLEVPTAGPYKGKVIQYSMVDPEKFWVVVQTRDSVTPGNEHYSEKSHYAKLLMKGDVWDPAAKPEESKDSQLAHSDQKMTCYACHSAWMTSCFGCHLPMVANRKRPMNHNEGGPETRNWTAYNFQVLRDDVFMLGIDGTATGNRIAPVRSSSAVIVGSQNANRLWLYSQQQTISSEGYSGQAMNTHVPHTVRARETKGCTDCHISKDNDNNAIMAQLLLLGTNYVNFLGRYVYVAEGHHGISAVVATERSEPQAVIGSTLHELAYPKEYKKHKAGGDKLHEHYHHHGHALSLQMRGEYLYVAEGEHGVHIYDIANIDNKDFSERITTAPVSPLGQKFYVKTKYATAIASPTTLGVDPTRQRFPENEEQPISLVYAYLYVSDREEGLVMINAATLLDGDPANNFLKKDYTFNPNGLLNGAENLTVAGDHAYILCDRGLVIVNVANAAAPKVVSIVEGFKKPKGIAVQFRYAFVTDATGMHVVDITLPEKARLVPGATIPLEDAHQIYVARTYAYIAGGKQGLVIVDVERPEQPKIDQIFTAGGVINDAHDVKVGMTNASAFAYVADGKNGLRIVQLTSPETMATNSGFSPRPEPRLIATHPTKGESLAVSKGLDRDRGVDESGHQLVVFGRRGARPFNLEEMRRLYLKPDGTVYKVSNEVPKGPTKGWYAEAQTPPSKSVSWWPLGWLALFAVITPFALRRRR